MSSTPFYKILYSPPLFVVRVTHPRKVAKSFSTEPNLSLVTTLSLRPFQSISKAETELSPNALHQNLFIWTSRLVNNSYILAGEHDQRVIEGEEQVLDVSSVCFHEGFSMQHLRNDIAVLTLGNPVALTDRVSTVCLPQRKEQVPTGTKCYITGIPAQSMLRS